MLYRGIRGAVGIPSAPIGPRTEDLFWNTRSWPLKGAAARGVPTIGLARGLGTRLTGPVLEAGNSLMPSAASVVEATETADVEAIKSVEGVDLTNSSAGISTGPRFGSLFDIAETAWLSIVVMDGFETSGFRSLNGYAMMPLCGRLLDGSR